MVWPVYSTQSQCDRSTRPPTPLHQPPGPTISSAVRAPDRSSLTTSSGGGNSAPSAEGGAGAAFAASNQTSGNKIVAFRRAGDGTAAGTYPTGGTGDGFPDNSVNSVILGEESPTNHLSHDHRFLFAANLGSSSILIFRYEAPAGLKLVGVESQEISHPTSIALRGNVLYVLNAQRINCDPGTGANITGFRVGGDGTLTPIPGSTQSLSGMTPSGCAQIAFNPSGDVRTVTEVEANVIDSCTVDSAGVAHGPIVNANGPSSGPSGRRTPIMACCGHGEVPGWPRSGWSCLVRRGQRRYAHSNQPNGGNGQTDTCWVVNTADGKYAYVTARSADSRPVTEWATTAL